MLAARQHYSPFSVCLYHTTAFSFYFSSSAYNRIPVVFNPVIQRAHTLNSLWMRTYRSDSQYILGIWLHNSDRFEKRCAARYHQRLPISSAENKQTHFTWPTLLTSASWSLAAHAKLKWPISHLHCNSTSILWSFFIWKYHSDFCFLASIQFPHNPPPDLPCTTKWEYSSQL